MLCFVKVVVNDNAPCFVHLLYIGQLVIMLVPFCSSLYRLCRSFYFHSWITLLRAVGRVRSIKSKGRSAHHILEFSKNTAYSCLHSFNKEAVCLLLCTIRIYMYRDLFYPFLFQLSSQQAMEQEQVYKHWTSGVIFGATRLSASAS